jgi:hypothetical protein
MQHAGGNALLVQTKAGEKQSSGKRMRQYGFATAPRLAIVRAACHGECFAYQRRGAHGVRRLASARRQPVFDCTNN